MYHVVGDGFQQVRLVFEGEVLLGVATEESQHIQGPVDLGSYSRLKSEDQSFTLSLDIRQPHRLHQGVLGVWVHGGWVCIRQRGLELRLRLRDPRLRIHVGGEVVSRRKRGFWSLQLSSLPQEKLPLILQKALIVVVSQGEGGRGAAGRDFELVYYLFPQLVIAYFLGSTSYDHRLIQFAQIQFFPANRRHLEVVHSQLSLELDQVVLELRALLPLVLLVEELEALRNGEGLLIHCLILRKYQKFK